MEERLGKMRKGIRERMRKGAIVMTSWSSSIKICFFLAYRMHYWLKCHGMKQNAKICAIGEQNVIN